MTTELTVQFPPSRDLEVPLLPETQSTKWRFLKPEYTIPAAATLLSAVTVASVVTGGILSWIASDKPGAPQDPHAEEALKVAKNFAIATGASMASAVVYTAGKALYRGAQNYSRFCSRFCEVFTDSVKLKKPEGIIANTAVGIAAIPSAVVYGLATGCCCGAN